MGQLRVGSRCYRLVVVGVDVAVVVDAVVLAVVVVAVVVAVVVVVVVVVAVAVAVAVAAVVAVFTLHRYFYPTTSAVHPVSVLLLLHPMIRVEIQILWSQS